MSASLIVTLTKVGYDLSLIYVIPMADYAENRGVVLVVVGMHAIFMTSAAWSSSAPVFLACAFITVISSAAVHVLVLYAAQLGH